MDKNQKYQNLINFLFNREESEGDWRFSLDLNEPTLTEEEFISFLTKMLDNYNSDLAQYSDWQLSMGLEYIFNNTLSNMVFFLRDGNTPIELRAKAIKALKNIFKDCLNNRCERILCHLSEGGNSLNNFCYMLWDTTPLTYCEETEDAQEIYEAVADVMQFSLTLDNPACIESGLHGLGHLEPYYKDAPRIIRENLRKIIITDNRLLKYAEYAEKGDIL